MELVKRISEKEIEIDRKEKIQNHFKKAKQRIFQSFLTFCLKSIDLCKGQKRILCYDENEILVKEHIYRNNIPYKIISYYPNGEVMDMSKYDEAGKLRILVECYKDGSIKLLELHEEEFNKPVELRWFENGKAWQIPLWAGFSKDRMQKGYKYAKSSIKRI